MIENIMDLLAKCLDGEVFIYDDGYVIQYTTTKLTKIEIHFSLDGFEKKTKVIHQDIPSK